MPLQIFHNLSTKTKSSFFQNVDTGHIVLFSFHADPNYGHLSGSIGTKLYVCTGKLHWHLNDYKFNFKPLDENHIGSIVTIADIKTGMINTCEIHDKGYCILEVRNKESKQYYHPTLNSDVDVLFEPTSEQCWSVIETDKWRLDIHNQCRI